VGPVEKYSFLTLPVEKELPNGPATVDPSDVLRVHVAPFHPSPNESNIVKV
jgi:hypothetical protein